MSISSEAELRLSVTLTSAAVNAVTYASLNLPGLGMPVITSELAAVTVVKVFSVGSGVGIGDG